MSSSTSTTPQPLHVPDPADLFEFAWMPPNFDTKLEELALKAQVERWDEPDYPGSLKFPILANYVKYTFRRIVEEHKVVYATDENGKQVAAFNTGLFTPHYEPIFATFEANTNTEKQPWVLKGWSTPADFRMRPWASTEVKAARYFGETSELIYDPDLDLDPALHHILDENLERFPDELKGNPHLVRNALEGAINQARKRAQMNWKTAVPQYYFGYAGKGEGYIQLLLPLCIVHPDRADLALVVDKVPGEKRYRAHTVLTLAMAYKNARLIARPYSDWLGEAPAVPSIQAGA